MRFVVARLATLVLIVAAGCGGAVPATIAAPEETVRRYVEAVRNDDATAAYALLDDETRRRVTLEDFERRFRENAEELRDQATELVRAVESPSAARAELDVPSGERATLTLEGGVWRVDGTLLPHGRATEPIDAIFAFRRVLARGSLEPLWALLPRDRRAELEAEAQRFLDDTADPYDLTIEARDDTADVRTTSGRVVRLVREAGTWRIASLGE